MRNGRSGLRFALTHQRGTKARTRSRARTDAFSCVLSGFRIANGKLHILQKKIAQMQNFA